MLLRMSHISRPPLVVGNQYERKKRKKKKKKKKKVCTTCLDLNFVQKNTNINDKSIR